MVRIALFSAKNYDVDSFRKHVKDMPEGERPEVTFIHKPLSECTVQCAKDHDAICVFVNDKCDAAIVDTLHGYGIKLILCRCAGFDNVDFAAASEKGIPVLRVPAYSPFAVAEFAWSLLNCINRKIHLGYGRNRTGNFDIDGLQGMDMHGKTAGVIGTGCIGRIFIGIALGYGMNVKCYDVYQVEELKTMKNVAYCSLEEVLSKSDILTLHVPYLPSTHHILNAESLKLVQPHVLIVNTARGALVDTPAMVAALNEKRVAGYAADVYENESGYFFNDHSNEPIQDPILVSLVNCRNAILTAHQAFLTNEALDKIAITTLQNSSDYLVHKKVASEHPNRVPPPPMGAPKPCEPKA